MRETECQRRLYQHSSGDVQRRQRGTTHLDHNVVVVLVRLSFIHICFLARERETEDCQNSRHLRHAWRFGADGWTYGQAHGPASGKSCCVSDTPKTQRQPSARFWKARLSCPHTHAQKIYHSLQISSADAIPSVW